MKVSVNMDIKQLKRYYKWVAEEGLEQEIAVLEYAQALCILNKLEILTDKYKYDFERQNRCLLRRGRIGSYIVWRILPKLQKKPKVTLADAIVNLI